MKLEANITSFAPTHGYICDIDKHRKAQEGKFDFRMISPGYFLCISEGNAYAISEYQGEMGCACADMTYRCPGNEACKHLIAFMELKEYPLMPIDSEHETLLKAAGWIGETLHPSSQPGPAKKKRKPIHDPERTPVPAAAKRAEQKESYAGKTIAEIVRAMSQKELKKNAAKGGIAAIAEVERRAAEEVKA